jgi:hypothetical protein
LALLPINYREFLAKRAGQNALTPKGDSRPGGGVEAPALQGQFEKYAVLGEIACPTLFSWWMVGGP